jgi:DNA replication protein DnaC
VNTCGAQPTRIGRDVIEQALTPDFLSEARNFVLVGLSGLGKIMIAQKICQAVVMAGHSVLFPAASKLLTELYRQTPTVCSAATAYAPSAHTRS